MLFSKMYAKPFIEKIARIARKHCSKGKKAKANS